MSCVLCCLWVVWSHDMHPNKAGGCIKRLPISSGSATQPPRKHHLQPPNKGCYFLPTQTRLHWLLFGKSLKMVQYICCFSKIPFKVWVPFFGMYPPWSFNISPQKIGRNPKRKGSSSIFIRFQGCANRQLYSFREGKKNNPSHKKSQWSSSWWFQPIWKICSSNWIISPGIRDENSKNIPPSHPHGSSSSSPRMTKARPHHSLSATATSPPRPWLRRRGRRRRRSLRWEASWRVGDMGVTPGACLGG